MNGRVLTERLLATTSLAALLFATGTPEALALPACSVVPAGGSFSNSGSVPCVAVTTSSVSVTNNLGATIGPSGGSTAAVNVSGGGALSGGITNSGTITGGTAGAVIPAINIAGLVEGGITNSGTITTAATGAVFSYGPPVAVIAINASSFGGGITNSGTVALSAAGTAAFVATINVSTFTGNIVNSGTVSLSLADAGTGIFNYGAVALSVNATTFNGNVINSGLIAASVIGTSGAGVVGISLNASIFSGNISNSGTVSLSALTPGTGAASGAGLRVNVSTFTGGIFNSGTIAGSVSSGGRAEAYGISLFGTVFSGNLSNSGTISISGASSGSTSNANVTINGITSAFSTFAGSINNGGTIAALGTSSGSSCSVSVNGIAVSNADVFGIATAGGGIVNSGTISVTATANSNCCASAKALGVTVVFVSTFNGGVTNSGTITAIASVTGGSNSEARAGGINVLVSTFIGNIVNSGTISAAASISGNACCGRAIAAGIAASSSKFVGGITNAGTITVSAQLSANSSGSATATGITVRVSSFAGPIVNSGLISATATNLARAASAQVAGIAVGASTTGVFGTTSAGGGIVNSGSIITAATAGNSTADNACANAQGVRIRISTFNGGITNSGSIAATAMAASGNSAAAIAVGITAEFSTFNGGVNNSGTISAGASVTGGFASAAGVSFLGSVFNGGITNSGAIVATATNLATSTGNSAVATGLLIFVSTFSGTITNSGSIVARASSAGTGGHAFGLVVASSNFSGNIVNSGTIAGLITGGSGYGAGIQLLCASALALTNSGTITGSTWGIDASNGNGVTINQTGGLISGGNATSGGAILLSSGADTVNISGGQIGGNIVGGGAANIVNVNMGSGTFSYAGQVTNVGMVKLNSGTLMLQNLTAPGISTVAYNQSAGSTLALEVSPAATNHASIAASGAVSLASGSVFQAFEGDFAWIPGTYSYAGVVTAGSTTGSFTATSNSPFFVASLSQSSTVDNLTLTMLSPSQVPGLNANQQSVASAIIGIPGGNLTLDQLFTLSNPGPALTQLSGSQFTTTNYQPLIQAWQMFTDSLSDRLSQGDGYGGTISASLDPSHGIQFAQADIPQVAQMSDAGQGRPPSMPHQWGAWARGYGLSSNASSTATSAPYSESGAGLIVGADNQITDRIVAGVALNVSSDKASVSGGGFTQTNAYQGSAYGQYSIDPNWYVNGIAGFGWQTYKSARVVSFITTSVDNGSFDGQSYRAYGETGYTLHPAMLPLTRITPYLGLGYLHVSTDGFTESGPTALTLQSMDANSFTTTLGARAAATFQIGGTSFRPELRAAWQHEFLDQAATIRAAFAAAPASLFSATGTGFGRESFLGGAGMTTTITSSTQVFFDYDAKVTGGYTAQAISGGLRVQF